MEKKTELSGQDIDNILDDIEEKEQQINNRKIIDHDANWNEIIKQLRNKNIEWIKNLIRSKQIHINSIEPTTGNTILIYAVCVGDLDLIKCIINFGADVHIKNKYNLDAFDYAMRYCRRPITELIFYRQLRGLLGNDLKNINIEIHKRNQEANYIWQYKGFPDEIIDFIVQAIEDRAEFNENMLYYSWYFILLKSSKDNTDPFEHILWKTMMKVFESIISNTNDKKAWTWLKERFINSYVWFLPHPKNTNQPQQQNSDGVLNMQQVLKTTLFYELLTRIKTETQKQSDILLKGNINKIISETSGDWNELVAFTKKGGQNRQDTCGCLIPKYNAPELTDDKFPASVCFSAKRYYDVNVYLSELVFRANTLDEMFQVQMKGITAQINEAIGTHAVYKAGPVKTYKRSQVKTEYENMTQAYPTSAAIVDMNRCAIQFNTVREMLDYIRILSNRVEHGQAGCVKQILGCTNGWSVYNPKIPQYSDIKLNVLVQSNAQGTIIAEVQFLLGDMVAFKRHVHRLFSVEKKFGIVYNYQMIARKMGTILDFADINVVIHDLAVKDDLRYFEDLWENMIDHSIYNLAAHKNCIHMIMNAGGQIHKYLTDNYKEMYRESLLYYINNVIKLWFMVLEDVTQCGYNALQFIQKFIHLFDTSINVNSIEEGTEALRACNIIFDLLNHNIYSYIDVENNKIKAPMCRDFNGCNYHGNTHFKLVNDTFEGGTLYAFGDGTDGQLGIKEYEAKACRQPNIVVEFDNNHTHLLAMDSYNKHHLAIDVNHKVYSWGNNDYGQLGDGKKLFAKASKPIPNLLKSFNKYEVISVAVGSYHSLILTNDGNIWSFGDNRKGQLGNGKKSKDGDKNPTPKIIKKLSESNEYFMNISAGSEHSAAVSKNGKLYCWGSNEHGECGADPDLGKIMVVPYEVEINSEYKNRNSFNPFYALEAGCGWNYTLLLTTNHTLLQFGKSMVEESQHWKPLVIPNLSHKRIMHISSSYNHTLLVTEDGDLYSFGSGACGRLGHGLDTVEVLPKRIEYFNKNNIKIMDCEGGSRHSGVITSTGELYMFGRNASKELGYNYVMETKENDNSDPYNSKPKKVEFFNNFKVRYMSLGIQHSHIVVSDDDEKKSDDDDAHYLDSNQEERIWCPQFKMYVKNEKLFGKNWILLTQKK